VIEVNGVSKRYGDTDALTDVSVSVPDGSLTALLGPSGGGKTTLLRVIAGLETPDTGSVVMDDQDVTTVPVRRLHDEVHVTTLFVTHDQTEAMEISEQIVVVNEGKVEQVASPQDIYDKPATAFVMNFVGPVTRVGGRLVRPHDVQVLNEPAEAASPAVVQKLLRLGFEVRAELLPEEGEPIVAQLSKSEADMLELAEGDIVHVRLDPTAPIVAAPAS
jgi:ABC-type sulfate/molybdate transport systems ATPase subunit